MRNIVRDSSHEKLGWAEAVIC